ncbi:hypothetical protein [Wolbachia endosymbiont (group E) of Neria commutata]|uniref:hypothetical protein n=1 Tax=Wolbachia endosymbiont (group E) of Neria commutata TaxID=3066149 RepID=UPI0031329C08
MHSSARDWWGSSTGLLSHSIVIGNSASVGLSLFGFKSIWHNKFDLDQFFCTQEQVDILNSIDLTWLKFLLDKKVIGSNSRFSNVLLSEKEIINGLNNVNFDLFSALVDSIINQCHSKEYEQLRDYRGGNLVNSSSFYEFLAFFQTKENVEKFNRISLDSLDALMSYATIPKGTRSYYLKKTIDKKEDPCERESSIFWSEFQDTLCMIKGFFNGLTKEEIENLNKLSSANPALLKLFHDKGIIGKAFLSIFKNETRFDNLNSIDVDLISTLIDSVIDKLNLREAEKLANENLNYGYNPVLSNLSEVFTIFDIKENTKKFNSMNHELINVLVNVATSKAVTMRNFWGSHEDEQEDKYYRTCSDLRHTVDLICKLFPRITQDTINTLNLNLDLLKTLINKSIVEDIQDILRCFKNREQVEMLCNLDLDLVKTLLDKQIIRYNSIVETNAIFVVYNGTRGRESIYRVDRESDRLYTILSLKTIKVLVDKEIIKSRDDIESLYITISDIQKEVNDLDIIGCGLLKILVNKRFIQNIKDIGELLKKENLITNIQNNPSQTILNMDSLVEVLGTDGIKELISHPKYTEHSGCLVRNCQLALALLSKGIIENITIDYLFDSEKIKNDLKNNEFIKNVELTDASDNVTSSMDEIIDGMFIESQNDTTNDPMPKLKDLSLKALISTMPSARR